MNQEFVEALAQLERERGIAKEVLIEAVEAALVSALKRDQRSAQNIRVQLDPATGEIKVFHRRTVVEEVTDEREEISLAEAQALDPRYQVGDVVEELIQPKEFGRIAAQTAKQVVVQRIREAERALIYDEYANRVGDIVTGIVHRFEQKNVYVDLGKVEGILPPGEQTPGEKYEQGMRLKVYIVEVKRTTKGPQVIVSRSRAGLLKRLFELEVPEIQEGLVEIKAIAREPGARSKIAVYSREPHVDPVGACVGARGSRVQMIVRELRGERIDIIPWNPDWEIFISKAMSPARVAAVQLAPSKRLALVVVPDHQLSLAIGKEGQNARLAAKLTGWRIDIRSESQIAEMTEEELEAIIPYEDQYTEVPVELPPLEEEAVPVAGAGVSPEGMEEGEPAAVPAAPEETMAEEMAVNPPEEVEEPEEEEEERRSKETVKRRIRKGRSKKREIELELETVEETGIGFFSDVLGSRTARTEPETTPEKQPQEGGPVAVSEEEFTSPLALALSKVRAMMGDQPSTALAEALLKAKTDEEKTEEKKKSRGKQGKKKATKTAEE
ncbi:MAG: transcription termination/antitermination protein NusA [Firmicutes bacterium]|nr:transcription termination/antitermination protein NusA [Bacillota bacterium]